MFAVFAHNLARILTFAGRTRPGKFWPYVACVIVLWLFAGMGFMGVEFLRFYGNVSGAVSGEVSSAQPSLMPDFDYFLLVTNIAVGCVIVLLAAAVVRRLHDRNMSGFWGLLPLPFLAFGLFFMNIVFDDFTSDDWSFDYTMFFAAFANNVIYLVSLAILIVLLIGRSTPGDNRFGPQPAA